MSLRVEIVTYAPTVFTHCQRCEVTFRQAGLGRQSLRDQAQESLPPDLLEEFRSVSDWVHDLADRYGGRIDVKVTDAVSLEGAIKSFLRRLRHYPAFVVAGETFHERDAAESAIAAHLTATRRGGNGG
jgi:hypothetical protein